MTAQQERQVVVARLEWAERMYRETQHQRFAIVSRAAEQALNRLDRENPLPPRRMRWQT